MPRFQDFQDFVRFLLLLLALAAVCGHRVTFEEELQLFADLLQIPRAALDGDPADFKISKAGVVAARSKLDRAELQLARTDRAWMKEPPISGEIYNDCLVVSVQPGPAKDTWVYDKEIDWNSPAVAQHFHGKKHVFVLSHGWRATMRGGKDHRNSPFNKDGLFTRMVKSLQLDKEAADSAFVCVTWPSGGTSTNEPRNIEEYLTFYIVRERARRVGGTAVTALLKHLSRFKTQLHLVGHSFGCIVVADAVLASVVPVTSVVLLQAAMSCSAFTKPPAKDVAGRIFLPDPTPTVFHQVSGKVQQAFVVITSLRDEALAKYPAATCAGNCASKGRCDCVWAYITTRNWEAEYVALGFDGPKRSHTKVILNPASFDTRGVIYHINSTAIIGDHGDVTNHDVTAKVWSAIKFGKERYREVENLTGHYIFFLGAYRALYILNWIYRSFHERGYKHHYVVYFAGIVQTALYVDFFCYYAISKY